MGRDKFFRRHEKAGKIYLTCFFCAGRAEQHANPSLPSRPTQSQLQILAGPAALPAPPATQGQLQILAGQAALPAPQVPEPIPSGVAAPNVLPSPKKAVTVIPVTASTCSAISKEGSDGHSCDGFHSAIPKKGCFGN